jgi:opacity protein-like surface antigen
MLKTLGVAAVAVALTVPAYAADDFKKIENNIRVEVENIGADAKLNFNDTAREVGIDYTKKGIVLRYERAEGASAANDENRIGVGYSQDVFAAGPISVNTGITAQYRMPEADGGDKWFRISPVAKVTIDPMVTKDADGKAVKSKVQVYGQVQPNLAFEKVGVDNFTEVVDTEWKAGVDYAVNKHVTAGIFMQTDTNADWDRTQTFVGTGIKIKF